MIEIPNLYWCEESHLRTLSTPSSFAFILIIFLFAVLQVANFEKSDPCAVVDVPQWTQESFALPA